MKFRRNKKELSNNITELRPHDRLENPAGAGAGAGCGAPKQWAEPGAEKQPENRTALKQLENRTAFNQPECGGAAKRWTAVCIVICILFFVPLTAESAQLMQPPKVLMYHLVLEEPWSEYTSMFVRPKDLEEQISLLKKERREFLFAEEYHRTLLPSVILTFDDGYEDNYTELFPILKRNGAKATVFLISDFIGRAGYLNEAQIREMSESGLVSFQSHTKTHRDLTTLPDKELREELGGSIRRIETVTGKPVTAVSYPMGQYTDSMLLVVKDYADIAFSVDEREVPCTLTRYAISRESVKRDMTMKEFEALLK